MIAIILIFWLYTKHTIADYVLQNDWMVFNKGNARSAAGYIHAAIHAAGTFMVLAFFGLPLWLALADFVIHFIIDWLKVNTGKKYGWGIDKPVFWWAFGADQYLHMLTYLAIVALVMK